MNDKIDPKKIRRIHMIAVCGTGMGSLAGMLKNSGYDVSGSDQHVYPPMDSYLMGVGIHPQLGYSASHLDPSPDLVIIGNAVSKSNPEVEEVLRRGLPYLSFPEALATFFLERKKSIVISGTHGKTTTTALAAWILESTGLDPGCMIGGWAKNFSGNSKLGNGPYFVVEGDEYDCAFFDKGPKFLHYRPYIGVITGIEFDHSDIYKDVQSIQSAFRKLIDLFPAEGFLVAAYGDPRIDEILPPCSCSLERYGLEPGADWRADQITPSAGLTQFRLLYHGRSLGQFSVPLTGHHNIKNTLSVLAIAHYLGLSMEGVREGLMQFKGVKRRQEIIGEFNGIVVIDDFAHHPTAIFETLSGLKKSYPGRRLWAIFEPRSATSRRNVFQEAFARAFQVADCTVISNVYSPHTISPQERLDPVKIVEALEKKGQKSWFLPTAKEIVSEIVPRLREGDVVCIMSSGSFDGIHGRILEGLKEATG